MPDAVLAIDADSRQVTMYAPERDLRFENPSRRNDFPSRPLQADPSLGSLSGLADLRPIEQLAADLDSWVAAGRALRVDPGHPGPIVRESLGPVQGWSPLQHVEAWLQQAQPSARMVSAYREVARTRMVKSPREVALLRRAAGLGVDGITHAATFVRARVDERGLEAELEAFYKRGGARRLPFEKPITRRWR